MTRPLVLVRPEPGLSGSRKRAEALGLTVIAKPLFEVVSVPWDAPPAEQFDAMLVTSANTFRFGGDRLRGYRSLPVYAVGNATAQMAGNAGFEVAGVGIGGVDDLLATIPDTLRLLHPGGVHLTAVDWEGITRVAVYESRTIADPDLPSLGGSVVALHSVRAARRLAELTDVRGDIRIVAASASIAEAAGEGWRSVDIAVQPNDSSLLALAGELCQTGSQ